MNNTMTKISRFILKMLLGMTVGSLLCLIPYYIGVITFCNIFHIASTPVGTEVVFAWLYGAFEAIIIVAILYASLILGEKLYNIIGNALQKIIHPLTKDKQSR